MKLLLVEDEEDLSRMLARALHRSGYTVDTAGDGQEALYLFEVNAYDLIILDLNLPKLDGLDVLRRIRETDPYARVLILSARDKVEERVAGLDLGANDYLTKPFDLAECEARVRALLRTEFLVQDTVKHCGALSIDLSARVIAYDGAPLPLTRKEYCILEYLFRNQAHIISAETLFEHIWDSQADPFSNAVKYHIHSLKKKLREAGAQHDYIKNLRGQGYMLAEKSHEESE